MIHGLGCLVKERIQQDQVNIGDLTVKNHLLQQPLERMNGDWP